MTNWVEVYYAEGKAEHRQRGAKIKGRVVRNGSNCGNDLQNVGLIANYSFCV